MGAPKRAGILGSKSSAFEDGWAPRLASLCDRIRAAARGAVAEANALGDADLVAKPVRQGAGDVTYAIDDRTESEVSRWTLEAGESGAFSLLTEDTGWRHFAARAGSGRSPQTPAPDFRHGGPRIVLDPIDGTRNVMADLRSAWTVVALAPPGTGVPRLSDVTLGIVAEIPDSRARHYRVFHARSGGPCTFELRSLDSGAVLSSRTLDTGDDARPDHGYFPFFRYTPDQRPALARIEARFFELLAEHEDADLRYVFDDQYISNAGQLALLALGTYRTIADLRAHLARQLGRAAVTSKPYDVAGAIVCARAAGCVVEKPTGEPLDFPLDCTTPVDFAGFVNAATRARLARHLWKALSAAGDGASRESAP